MTGKRVIVIGAGPGGLAATMLLARRDYAVTVYEQEPQVGGRNGALVLGDYTFDIGPTFFLMKTMLEEIFARTDRRLENYVELTQLDPMYRLRFGDGREFYPSTDREKMRDELERFSPGSHAGYLKYLAKEKRKYDKLIPCLAVPYQSPLDFLSWQFVRSLPYLDAHRSLYGVLGRYFDDPELRLSFTFQAKYIGMSPWTAPGTFSIISYIEHGEGVFHVTGGLNRLARGMAKAAEEMGADIRTATPVAEVLVEDRAAVGVRLADGTEERADYVVINADFAHAMSKLVAPAHRRKYSDARLARKRYSCSTFMLYLGVGKRYDDIPHHSIVFADDYRANVDAIGEHRRVGDDFSFYVQNASVTDATLAPAGKSAIYVLVPVANNRCEVDWATEKQGFRDKVVAALEKRGGYADLSAHIEEERIITPADWENERAVYRGATFNLSHDMRQMLLFRPHNRFEELRNCYLVGGGTHPGSGLPTIYQSGRISAGLICRRDGRSL